LNIGNGFWSCLDGWGNSKSSFEGALELGRYPSLQPLTGGGLVLGLARTASTRSADWSSRRLRAVSYDFAALRVVRKLEGSSRLQIAAVLNCRSVGSYGTRNIVVIVLSSQQILYIDLSKFSSPVGVLLSRGFA
jgi:hypothetical protein